MLNYYHRFRDLTEIWSGGRPLQVGLLSQFIAMTTDSRSFLSFPRREYFRRILCDLIGGEVERGELPNDNDMLGRLIAGVCYGNAAGFFRVHRPRGPGDVGTRGSAYNLGKIDSLKAVASCRPLPVGDALRRSSWDQTMLISLPPRIVVNS
jgi:hypothetical protein